MSTTARTPARKRTATKAIPGNARGTKTAGKRQATKAAPKVTTTPATKGPREGTIMAAALAVLKGKRTGMSVQAIYDEALARGLYKPSAQAKTPVASLAARLAVA